MTLEELFAEEYKELKKDNEELKSCIIRMEKNLYHEENENTEFRSFLLSLNLRIKKSNYDGEKYIPIGTISIFEDNKFYDLISKFATEESEKKESEEEE